MITEVLHQGTTRVVRASQITDSAGNPVEDWGGWSARGVARAEHVRGPVIAEWSSAPVGDELPVTFGAGSGSGGSVEIPVTAELSAGWSARVVVIHVEITSPVGDVERIIDVTYRVSPEAVTD